MLYTYLDVYLGNQILDSVYWIFLCGMMMPLAAYSWLNCTEWWAWPPLPSRVDLINHETIRAVLCNCWWLAPKFPSISSLAARCRNSSRIWPLKRERPSSIPHPCSLFLVCTLFQAFNYIHHRYTRIYKHLLTSRSFFSSLLSLTVLFLFSVFSEVIKNSFFSVLLFIFPEIRLDREQGQGFAVVFSTAQLLHRSPRYISWRCN